MRKRRIKLLNNIYIIAYHIKLKKEQSYFSKAKLNFLILRTPYKIFSRTPGGTRTPG
jgi:hypothetical protein